MGALRKRGEGLNEGGVGRVKLLLGKGVVGVALGVEFVTARAKVGRGKGGGDITQEGSGEVDDLGEGEAELAGGGLVGVGCPGGGIEAGDIVGVRRANNSSVAWGIDFLETKSAGVLSLFLSHTP